MRFIKLLALTSLLMIGCYDTSGSGGFAFTEEDACQQIYMSRQDCIAANLQRYNHCIDQGRDQTRCLIEYGMQNRRCEALYRQRVSQFEEVCGFEDFGVPSDADVGYGDE